MRKLFTVTTSIVLTLGACTAAPAYSGAFDTATLPSVLQFEARPDASAVAEGLREDRLNTPRCDDSAARTQAARDPQHVAADQFQPYFDSHFRAHLVLDAATQQRLRLQ